MNISVPAVCLSLFFPLSFLHTLFPFLFSSSQETYFLTLNLPLTVRIPVCSNLERAPGVHGQLVFDDRHIPSVVNLLHPEPLLQTSTPRGLNDSSILGGVPVNESFIGVPRLPVPM